MQSDQCNTDVNTVANTYAGKIDDVKHADNIRSCGC
jgi:hypothetical protein